MNIDIIKLKSNIVDYIKIDEKLNVDKKLLDNTELLDLKDTIVTGEITNSLDDYYLDLNVKGIMILPCSLTLEPVEYSFNIKIEGNYEKLSEEIDDFDKKVLNSLDIFPIIWENILMEIPMKVVNKNAKPITKGNGWKLVTEEEETVNHNFDKLNELL